MDLTYGTISDPKLKISIKLEGIGYYVSSNTNVFTQSCLPRFFFVDVDNDIFSTTILSLQQIKEGQFPEPGKNMCISTG